MFSPNENAIHVIMSLSREDIRENIIEVEDYDKKGSPVEKVTERPERIVIALDDDDTDGMLGIIYEKNSEGVLAGASALSQIMGVGKIAVVVRTQKQKQAVLNAYPSGCEFPLVFFDILEVSEKAKREEWANALYMHPCYLAKVADYLSDIKSGVILAEEGHEPEEVPFGTLWKNVIMTDAEKYCIGGNLYGRELLEMPITESFKFGSGVIHPIK